MKPIMLQKWRDLVFFHWTVPREKIQKTLPNGLFVDTYNEEAFIGIVPFSLHDVRPFFLPIVPPFLELNVRTYVKDSSGKGGIWFYSLDATSLLSVIFGRLTYRLPYFFSKIECEQKEFEFKYTLKKRNTSTFKIQHDNKFFQAQAGSLEHFLIERYTLFAASGKNLYSADVYHEPYPISLARYIEFQTTNSLYFDEPKHICYSTGVDVDIFALNKVINE